MGFALHPLTFGAREPCGRTLAAGACMKKGFQDGLARLVPEIGLTRYAESGNPLFLWEMVAELADLHFQKGINEENLRAIFAALPVEALRYLVMCAGRIRLLQHQGSLDELDGKPKGKPGPLKATEAQKGKATKAQKQIARALLLVDGKKNAFRDALALNDAKRVFAEDEAARRAGLKGEAREARALAGNKASDARSLARKIKRAKGPKEAEDRAARRALGIPKGWPGIGDKR